MTGCSTVASVNPCEWLILQYTSLEHWSARHIEPDWIAKDLTAMKRSKNRIRTGTWIRRFACAMPLVTEIPWQSVGVFRTVSRVSSGSLWLVTSDTSDNQMVRLLQVLPNGLVPSKENSFDWFLTQLLLNSRFQMANNFGCQWQP